MNNLEFITQDVSEGEAKSHLPALSKETVELQGKPIGAITSHRIGGGIEFNAVLNVHSDPIPHSGLAIGWGITRDQAIQNAFTDSRKRAKAYIESVDHLEFQINGGQAA
ncbi:hypothetical protein ACJJIK_10805 [Microbulbifer sp. ZKSA006]|uniref:hypothetical protein n=1 Tax=Microbulbifer sp. ZKSA006 TaxID=3243390 RepID=UPI00403A04AC